MAKCEWDPSKHGGKPCPIHGSGMWDENILTKQEKIEKLKEKGYTEEEIEEELKSESFDDDFTFEDDFLDNIDNIDYGKAEEAEQGRKDQAKNPERKDKYGNSLVSDKAFEIGQKGAQIYLDFMKRYYDIDDLKDNHVFISGLKSAVNKAITEAGLNPELDTTIQDYNEIIGSVLNKEVDIENERISDKEYTGYQPKQKQESKGDLPF